MIWIIQKQLHDGSRRYHDFAAFEEYGPAAAYLDSEGGAPAFRLVRRDITDNVQAGPEDWEGEI